MQNDGPVFLLVRNGRVIPDRLALTTWILGMAKDGRPWGWLPWFLSLIPRAIAHAPGKLWRRVTRAREGALNISRRAIRNGFPVAIWTPPGEWRVARTLSDFAQIIADGGEVAPPKDED